jgi:hypothetical protein
LRAVPQAEAAPVEVAVVDAAPAAGSEPGAREEEPAAAGAAGPDARPAAVEVELHDRAAAGVEPHARRVAGVA